MRSNISIKITNIIFSILGVLFYLFMNKIPLNFNNIFYSILIVFIGFTLQFIARIIFISFKVKNQKKSI